MDSVYLLRLEHNRWYVGWTRKPVDVRIDEHARGVYSAHWLKLHPFVELVHSGPGDEKDEQSLTVAMMREYGWRNVRGGKFTRPDLAQCPAELWSPAVSEGKGSSPSHSLLDAFLQAALAASEALVPTPDVDMPSRVPRKRKLESGRAVTECYQCGRAGHRVDTCPDTKCGNCGGGGHYGSACPLPRACFHCQSTDHRVDACPAKAASCYYCKGKGHWQQRCPRARCSACKQLGHMETVCPSRPGV